jgi:hypothetical protein
MTTTRGSRSLRHRGGDQWEVRVSLGPDPVSGRSAVHSVTVRGDLAAAQRELLAAQAEAIRASHGTPLKTVAELLGVWLQAEHDGKPSTRQNYRIAATRLSRARWRRAPGRLSPPVMTAAITSWRAAADLVGEAVGDDLVRCGPAGRRRQSLLPREGVLLQQGRAGQRG